MNCRLELEVDGDQLRLTLRSGSPSTPESNEASFVEMVSARVTERQSGNRIDLEEAINCMCEEIRSLDHPNDVATVYELLTGKTWMPKFIDGSWVLEIRQ